MKRLSLLLLGAAAIVVTLYLAWLQYSTPQVTLSPEHWQEPPSLEWHGANDKVGLYFWSKRRHSRILQVSETYLLEAAGERVPVRLMSISYPSLYPDEIRIGFELVNSDDLDFLLSQRELTVRYRM